MTLKYVELPLYEEKDYSYAVALEGDSYRLRFTYNSVMQLYTFSIADADQVVLISGVGLVPNYPMLADYIVGNLTGVLLLSPKSDKDIEFYKLYPDKIHLYYELSYIYDVPD